MKRLSRRARWCCCSGCAVVLLVPLALVFLAFTPPPRPRQLTATEKAEAAKKADSIVRQVKQIAKDAHEGRSRNFHLEIGENEVNELLRTDPELKQATQRLQISDPYVMIEENQVRLTAVRNVASANVSTSVTIVPSLGSDGRAVVDVESAQIGRLRLPDRVTGRIARRLARELTEKLNSGKARLTSLRVEPGKITVEGTTSGG